MFPPIINATLWTADQGANKTQKYRNTPTVKVSQYQRLPAEILEEYQTAVEVRQPLHSRSMTGESANIRFFICSHLNQKQVFQITTCRNCRSARPNIGKKLSVFKWRQTVIPNSSRAQITRIPRSRRAVKGR